MFITMLLSSSTFTIKLINCCFENIEDNNCCSDIIDITSNNTNLSMDCFKKQNPK